MFSIFKKKNNFQADLSWLGVDVHSHLLPGIDDGAPNVQTSISLIEGLLGLGLNKFICTPHIFKELYPNTKETIQLAYNELKKGLNDAKVEVEIEMGAEHMIDSDFDSKNNLVSLPGNHLLIEMSYLSESPNIEQTVFDLQIKGYAIVLAHPERYNFYHRDLKRYQRLKDMGCLFQLNLLSVTGYYGREVKVAAEYLIKNKLYDLAGTDLHHEKHLHALRKNVLDGQLFKAIGSYPFKNKEIFSNSKTG